MHLLLIGAYRDNEITTAHPLYPFLGRLADTNNAEVLTLKPLKPEHVQRIIRKILQCNNDQTDMLAGLCYEKTGGNPFFLRQFIKSLEKKELISFNLQERKWIIKFEHITECDATDNIVDLMVNKIAELPQRTIELLKLAACVNSAFDVKTLADVLDISDLSAAEALETAVQEGLVVSREKNICGSEKENNVPTGFRFLQDRKSVV